jgi:PKD repeat protein
MPRERCHLRPLVPIAAAGLLLLACGDDIQSPAPRPEPPAGQDEPAGSMLAPVDLVYICGNKFLATNSTLRTVEVRYRVVGTDEFGTMTLRPGQVGDQAHSETELETAERGTVELYVNEERVARRRNESRRCGAPAVAAAMAAGEPASSGEWGAPFTWPVVAVHLSVLPNGRVLSWGHPGNPQVWNPATGDFSDAASPSLLFCSGHALLPDGRLLVAGGHITDTHGRPDINLFSPGSASWGTSAPMQLGRWYPSTTTLASGEVLLLAGTDENGAVVTIPEIWSRGSVRPLSGAGRTLPYYPRVFVAPNGRVFYAGEQQTTRYLDPSGTGSWTTVANRLYGGRDYGAAVMYDKGKVLYVGGGRTTNTAEIIDLNSASPAWQWTGSMAFPRRHLNATVLPTGEVLVTSGTSGTNFNEVGAAVHAAELWNPTTGIWTTLASNTVKRAYHSTSVLLPDGRVLHTGSGDAFNAPRELNAELFSPPYLFQGTRPRIGAAPAVVGYGTTFTVTSEDADDIAQVSLVRLGSTTHGGDMNQRFQWLSFTREEGAVAVEAPGRNDAPPGHYMLFLLDAGGVPSVGEIIRVGTDGDLEPPPNEAPVANFSFSCTGLSCTFTNQSFDPDGTLTGHAWSFGDGETATATSPNHTYAAPGTYTVTLAVTDDEGVTREGTRSVTVGAVITLSVTGRQDATKQYMALTWSGASGPDVDVFRNGPLLINTPNDGKYTNARSYTGPAIYTYKVCLPGSSICSNDATVRFGTPANTPPAAGFTASCSDLTCAFSDGSTDPDGTVAAWQWDFGDGSTSSQRNPSHEFAVDGTFTVRLTVTDNLGGTGSATRQVTVPATNAPPVANFTSSCTGLTCGFTDQSTDADGTVTAWGWDFGDGGTSTARNPGRTYASAGTYTVTLTATDNVGATHAQAKSVTVSVAPPTAITLSVSGRRDATKQYMMLAWSGATGTTVDVYRNGPFLTNTPNDGKYTNSRSFTGSASYTYRVCQRGSTTACSNSATVTFP